MTKEEKAKAYDEALERARIWKDKSGMPKDKQGILDDIFPELKESEDERIRRCIGDVVREHDWSHIFGVTKDDCLAWLEKQGKSSDQIHYWTEEEIEPIISDYLRGAEHYGGMIGRLRCLKPKPLEKHGNQKSKQVSIWKHWKDGIAGNGEGEPIYLVKNGNTYSLNSCLGYECDYIELSELDNLMLEKQGEKKPYGQRQECADCQFNYAGECKGSCAMKRGEQKPIEMKTAEESLGIDSDTYNKIIDECIFGEQKSTDKDEPKFHEGEWIVWKDKCYKVNYNGCGYELVDQDGLSTSLEYGTVDTSARLWDITKDAKDGDVLAESKGDIILMFRGIGNTRWNDVIDYHFYYDCYRKDFIVQEDVNYWGNTENNQLKPATKEQRELLFQKMNEAGYTFDFDKKVSKKIEKKSTDNDMKEALRTEYEKGRADAIAEIEMQKFVDCIDCTNSKDCINCENGNMKETLVQTAWSEEDDGFLDSALWHVKNSITNGKIEAFAECLLSTWLKSLKERVQPQLKQDWSKEDESYLNTTIAYLKDAKEFKKTAENCINWLKSLKQRIKK